MSPPPLIEAEALGLARGGRRVLTGLDLVVEAGALVGVMGPNGAGKTSLLRALMGFDPPAAGHLRLFGRALPTSGRLLWREVGCAFQSPSLDGDLTARENLELGGAIAGMGRRARRAGADEGLRQVGMAAAADVRTKRLSGGSCRRVELARALIAAPRLLLLDEATSGLDVAAAREFWERVGQRRQGGAGVLSVTHLPEEAARVDRLLVLAGGRVVADAPPARLIAEVGGDVLTCEAADAAALVDEVHARLGLRATVAEGRLHIVTPRGHEVVPRLVEALGAGRLTSVALRRPTLADVFFVLTGHALTAPVAAPPGAEARR